VPPEELLLAASHSDDPAVRSAAVDGLAQTSSRAGYDRAADIIRDDGAPEVRLAAVKALGGSHDARAVAVLANAMEGHDKTEVLAAGESLGRIGSPQAISVLGEQLRDGTFEAETAAVFALNQTNKPEAAAILREQRDLHPDAQVRRLIKMALGEHLEEHEE
jgi:HEAT repeat protein